MNYTADSRIICRNFNQSLSTLLGCNFVHVCNRKVNGKACGLVQHTNAQHSNKQNSETTSTVTKQWLFLSSPLNINLWLTELADDKDRTFLSDGITSFKLMPTDIKFTQAEMENYRSATNPASNSEWRTQSSKKLQWAIT